VNRKAWVREGHAETHFPHPLGTPLNGGVGIRHVRAHAALHEPHDQQRNDQDHAEGVDPGRRLEKEIVDHQGVFEKHKVVFHAILALVRLQESRGIEPAIAVAVTVTVCRRSDSFSARAAADRASASQS